MIFVSLFHNQAGVLGIHGFLVRKMETVATAMKWILIPSILIRPKSLIK